MSQFQNLGITPRTALTPAVSQTIGTALEPFAAEAPQDRPVSLPTLFGALARRKKLVTAVFCTMFAAVIVATFVMGDKYESEFKVLVKQRGEPIASSAEGAGINRTADVTEEET